MPTVDFMQHKGLRVPSLDVSGSGDVGQGVAAFRSAQARVVAEPSKSVRLLTDVTGAHYNAEAVGVIKDFSRAITPNVKASAIVGVDGMKRIVVQSLLEVTGRDMHIFGTREQALDWLVAQ